MIDPRGPTRINEALRDLPLMDQLFMGMQAMNVDLVDAFLEEQEGDMLLEYMKAGRTPTPTAVFVSALSQMWVFAAYELLRTWRARVQEILRWDKELQSLDAGNRVAAVAEKRMEIERRASETRDAEARWQVFERVEDPQFVAALRLAINRTELAFRSVEAVRMTLAKHEVPRRSGVFAGAPGYGRIDQLNGSLYWQIELGGDEVAIVSRRDLADSLRALAHPNERILPIAIQAQVASMARQSYGSHRVTVLLEDGSEHCGVHIGWATEVVGVDGREGIPFEVARIVEVRPDPRPHDDQDESVSAPF